MSSPQLNISIKLRTPIQDSYLEMPEFVTFIIRRIIKMVKILNGKELKSNVNI